MMKILQKIITLFSALAVLSFNSCDSGGGNEASDVLAAPESLSGKRLRLATDDGPLDPFCGFQFRKLDFKADSTVEENGSDLLLDDWSYDRNGVQGNVIFQFSSGKRYSILLTFTSESNGLFKLSNDSEGVSCTTSGFFTLQDS